MLNAASERALSFEQTNQTQFLNVSNTADVPSILSGIRSVCALASVLLGGVATADGEVTPTSSIVAPSPTANFAHKTTALFLGDDTKRNWFGLSLAVLLLVGHLGCFFL